MGKEHSLSFFSKCNMVIMSDMEFNKSGIIIKLPFYFHIKDIPSTFFDEDSLNILEYYSKEIYEQYDINCNENNYLKYLKYIDLKQFTIDEEIKEYKDYMIKVKDNYIFKDHKSLYSFLIKNLYFNEIDFKLMKDFVLESQKKLIINFSDMLHKELKLTHDKKDISESYMILRGAFELGNPPIFPENIGKSISEYSFREQKTQRIYLARKCEIEQQQYDEMMNNKNNKKGKK